MGTVTEMQLLLHSKFNNQVKAIVTETDWQKKTCNVNLLLIVCAYCSQNRCAFEPDVGLVLSVRA